jgi:hypothetical protein
MFRVNSSGERLSTTRLILRGGKTNLKVVESSHEGAQGLTLPQLHRKYGDKLATFAQIMEYSTDYRLNRKNGHILYMSSNMASGTMTAFTKEKPLCDLADKNGIIFVEGSYKTITGRFGGFTLEQASKAGFVVDKPRAFLVAQKGYSIIDDGAKTYTINFKIKSPEQLKDIMRVFFSPDSPYENGQLRQTEPEFGLPLGKLSKPVDYNPSYCRPDENNLEFYYLRPGPAVPPANYEYGPINRFLVTFGDTLGGNGELGAVKPAIFSNGIAALKRFASELFDYLIMRKVSGMA